MNNLGISSRIENMLPLLDERQRRLFLATEAKILGYGGISEIQRISGISRVTITNGIKELENIRNKKDNIKRCRMEGGGRKKTEQKYPSIKDKLEQLLEVHTRGDPENPLKYTRAPLNTHSPQSCIVFCRIFSAQMLNKTPFCLRFSPSICDKIQRNLACH